MSWPTSVATNADLHIAVNNTATLLTGALSPSSTSIPAVDTTPFPSTGFVTINAEIIKYTSKTPTSFDGLTRGADGSVAASHSTNDVIHHYVIAAHHNDIKDELIALETDLFAGISGDLNDSVSPTATAADLKTRLDHFATQLKLITGKADWKTVPANTLEALETQQNTNESDITDNAAEITALKQNVINIIDNGVMEIWQRGTSFPNAGHGAYTADRWKSLHQSSLHDIDREATEVKTGRYSLKQNILNAAGGYCRLNQEHQDPQKYAGKKLTISAWVKSVHQAGIYIRYQGGYASVHHTGDGTWQYLTATTATLPNNNSSLNIDLGYLPLTDGYEPQVGITYYDSVSVVIGEKSIDAIPDTPALEWDRCGRYYEEDSFYEQTVPMTLNGANVPRIRGQRVHFNTMKAATPTITISNLTVTLRQDAATGSGSLADTANWTLAPVGVTARGFSQDDERASAQTGYSVAEIIFDWEASV